MPSGPRVAIGAPLYNNAAYLPLALDSLLGQTFGDFGIVLLDDASTDETLAVAERYAARDERVAVRRNERRLGIIASWRRAHALALELFPGAEYYAWASDHDVWRPGWLEGLVERLDRAPEAVLAYPLNVRISGAGEVIRPPWEFSTEGVRRPSGRLWRTCMGMRAGSMVYGLYRRTVLEQLSVYRRVREPDNLMMAELAIRGEFHQLPEILWERRFAGIANRQRQLRSLFLDDAPWYARLSPWIEHAGVLFRRYVVDEAPGIGRARGLGYWLEFVLAMTVAVTLRWTRKRYFGGLKKLRRLVARLRRGAYLGAVRLGLRPPLEEPPAPVRVEEEDRPRTHAR